jgi:hypothetical protein
MYIPGLNDNASCCKVVEDEDKSRFYHISYGPAVHVVDRSRYVFSMLLHKPYMWLECSSEYKGAEGTKEEGKTGIIYIHDYAAARINETDL